LLRLLPDCLPHLQDAPTGHPSDRASSRGATGGVCKEQGQYSPRADDTRILGIPGSCGRVAAHNPNYE